MKGFRVSVFFAAAVAASGVGAESVGVGLATVSDVEGVVLVSEGGRFSTVAAGSGLVRGSRLLTMEDASATVTYGDGCRLEVSANTMVVFRSTDECRNNSVDSKATGRQYASLGAPAAGAATVSAGSVATTTAAVSSAGAIGSPSRGSAEPGLLGVPAAGVVAGVSALAVGTYFVVSDNDNSSNDRSVSPSFF